MSADRNTLVETRSQAFALIDEGRFAEAAKLLMRLSVLVSNDSEVWLALGRVQMQLGQQDEAVGSFRRGIDSVPESAEAHFLLGVALGRSGNMSDARTSFEQALRLEPDHIDTRLKMGAVMQAVGDPVAAAAHYRKVQRKAPDNVELNVRLGRLYIELNDNNKAKSFFTKALACQPGHPEAICGLASLSAYKGDAPRAYQLLVPLLRQKPLNITAVTAFASICRPLQRCKEAIDLLEECLANGLDIESQSRLHFALGKVYDRQGDFARAFEHFRQGNDLANRPYNPWEEAQGFKEVISALNAAFFTKAPRANKRSKQKRPVFIVGMPRSGTTLVEQILAGHSSVYGAGELTELFNIATSLPEEMGSSLPYPLCLTGVDQKTLNILARRYLRHISDISPASVTVVTDKMPDNYRHLGLIELMLPKARVIHCLRDPLDTCLSCYFQHFVGGHFYSYDLRNLGMYYRLYERLMAHWHNTLGISVMKVRYEELVADPEKVSRSLLEFCGLKWSPECLQFHRRKRDVVTASHDQVRQPLYTGSVGRWKHYADHLQALREGLAQTIV